MPKFNMFLNRLICIFMFFALLYVFIFLYSKATSMKPSKNKKNLNYSKKFKENLHTVIIYCRKKNKLFLQSELK